MDIVEIISERDKITEQIREHVPLFAPFLENSASVADYSASLYQFSNSPLHGQRQELITRQINEKFSELFGSAPLKEGAAFNILDHHQILNHPLLIGANVIANIGKFFQAAKPDPIVVIASGDVPPNNYFSKSGFQFAGRTVPLFSASERESCTYFLPQRELTFIERLKQIGRWAEFTGKQQEFLVAESAWLANRDFSRCHSYRDQVSVLVQQQWPRMFAQELRPTLPDLLYITQEELTSRCLLELLQDKDNFIYAALFEESLRDRVLDNFRGIVVAWQEEQGKGTHFFWRKHPNRPQSLRMYLKGGQLVPHDPRFKELSLPLEPEVIIALLQKEEIYPSLFLIFSVLNFYAGIKPLAGYGSVVYLELFRQAWLKTLRASQFAGETPEMQAVDLTGLIGGIPLFFKHSADGPKAFYADDLICEGGVSESYLRTIFALPFNQLLSTGIAGMYDYFSQKYIPAGVKIKPKINFDDLARVSFDFL